MSMFENMLAPMIDNMLAKYGISRDDIEQFKVEAFMTLQTVRVKVIEMDERQTVLERSMTTMLQAVAELHADMLARKEQMLNEATDFKPNGRGFSDVDRTV